MPAKKAAKKSTGKLAKRNSANAASFDDLILKYPPFVQAVAVRLRAIVYEVLPKAGEKVYAGGWNIAIYNDGEDICGIAPMRTRCNFYLMDGAHIPDPDGLIQGTGKNMRHVKIASPDNMPVNGIKGLIRAGRKLARNKAGAGR